MNSPYYLRLACLCFAAFFLAQITAGVAIALFSPAILCFARRLRAGPAAMLLFSMRILPAAFAAVTVAFLCVPSYLLFEQDTGIEEVGAKCVGCALLSLLGWSRALARTSAAALRSIRFMRHCHRVGNPAFIPGEPWPVWVVGDCWPGLALVGIFRPEFVISAELAQALPVEEFSAALRHERAHWSAHDNLKRLLFLITPDPLLFPRCFTSLEREWARFTEWAADDRAVAGDRQVSVTLAAALVRAARLGSNSPAPPLMSTLLTTHCNLIERVNRLLELPPPPALAASQTARLLATVLLALGCIASPLLVSANGLNRLHEILELLMH